MENSYNGIDVPTKKAEKVESNEECSINETCRTPKSNKNFDTSNKTDFINKFIKSSSISPVDFIILPNIEIFSNDSDNSNEECRDDKNCPQLIDLCHEDKLRIGRLIGEVAKCKERNIEDTKIITDLQNEKFQMTIEINKLDKEITKLLTDCEEKDNEIAKISKLHSKEIQDHKMQITELKFKLDMSEKQWTTKWEETHKKNNALVNMIKKLNNSNKDLMFKYKSKKKKLRKALILIKLMVPNQQLKVMGSWGKRPIRSKISVHSIKISNDDSIGGKADKSCQIPSKSNSTVNIDSKTANEDCKSLDDAVPDQNTTDLQILSELFFKVAADENYEEKDPFVLLMHDNMFHNKNV